MKKSVFIVLSLLLVTGHCFGRPVDCYLYGHTGQQGWYDDYGWNAARSGWRHTLAQSRAIASRPGELLTISCGNGFGGSPGLKYRGMYWPEGVQEAAACALWIPGWKDWPVALQQRERNHLPPMIAGNAVKKDRGWADCQLCVLNGVRICVVGLAAPDDALCYLDNTLGQVQLLEPVEAVGRMISSIRASQPDVVVLVTAMDPDGRALNRHVLRRLIKRFPEIDLIMSPGRGQTLCLGGVYCVRGWMKDCLVRLSYDTVDGRILNIKELAVPQVQPELQGVNSNAGDVLFQTPVRIQGSQGESCRSDCFSLLGSAVCFGLDVDFALFRYPVGASIDEGEVRMSNVVNAFPDAGLWAVVSLTAQELAEVVAVLACDRGNSRYVAPFGFSVSGSGADTVLLDAEGVKLHSRKRYRVAVPQRIMASDGGHYPALRTLALRPESRLELPKVDNYELVIQYMTQHEKASNEPKP